MGIVSSMQRGPIKALGLNDPKSWNPFLWNLFGSVSKSGELVNESTALTYSAVWDAVRLISSTISCLPLHVQRTHGMQTINARELPLYRVLHDQFNPEMTAQVGREVGIAHILTWGNCYYEKQYDRMGNLIALWPITPNRVIVGKNGNGELVYEVTLEDGNRAYLTRETVLHVPGLGFDGIIGYSVIAMASKSIGLGMAMETFGNLFFSNGTHPGMVVTHPGKLSEDTHARLKKSLTDTYSGLGQSHRLMLLEDAMKIEKIGIAPEESQFLESRQFHISEIARWFNLPPHKLKDLTKSSFNNIESEQQSFVTDSILPWLIRLEQNFDMQLLSDIQKKGGYYTRHNVDGLLRANVKDRAEYYRVMFGIGAMSINDIRSKETMDSIENGDEHFIPLNMIPLSKINDYLKFQGQKSEPSRGGNPNENK